MMESNWKRTPVSALSSIAFLLFSSSCSAFILPTNNRCHPYASCDVQITAAARFVTRHSASASPSLDNKEGDDVVDTSYPALSREEMETLLDSIPIYAVSNREDGNFVMLTEQGNENSIVYLFLNPNTASASFKNLQLKQKATWDITRYSLGLIWFELLQNSGGDDSSRRYVLDGIEYRIVPDINEREAASMLLSQASNAGKDDNKSSPIFQSSYNEVPVFSDPRLRIEQTAEDNEGEATTKEQYPMFLSVQDLITTWQQGGIGGDAMINVLDLHDLIQQMQSESLINFRQTLLFPPSFEAPPLLQNDSSNKYDTESYQPTISDSSWFD